MSLFSSLTQQASWPVESISCNIFLCLSFCVCVHPLNPPPPPPFFSKKVLKGHFQQKTIVLKMQNYEEIICQGLTLFVWGKGSFCNYYIYCNGDFLLKTVFLYFGTGAKIKRTTPVITKGHLNKNNRYKDNHNDI